MRIIAKSHNMKENLSGCEGGCRSDEENADSCNRNYNYKFSDDDVDDGDDNEWCTCSASEDRAFPKASIIDHCTNYIGHVGRTPLFSPSLSSSSSCPPNSILSPSSSNHYDHEQYFTNSSNAFKLVEKRQNVTSRPLPCRGSPTDHNYHTLNNSKRRNHQFHSTTSSFSSTTASVHVAMCMIVSLLLINLSGGLSGVSSFAEASPSMKTRHDKIHEDMMMEESNMQRDMMQDAEYAYVASARDRDTPSALAGEDTDDNDNSKSKKFFLTPDDIQEEIHQEAVSKLPADRGDRDNSYLDDVAIANNGNSNGNLNSKLPRDEEGYDDALDVDDVDYQYRRYANGSIDQDSYIPEKPENVSVTWVTDSMMELSWSEPEKPNGKIEGYRIYYMWRNFTDVETVKQPLPDMKFALNGLDAFTEYKVWVKPFTWKNEGESSDPIVVKTDVRGPSPPRIVNISCLAEDALFIAWQRPTKFYNSIDYYYLDYRSEELRDFEEIMIEASTEPEQYTIIQNLTTNMMYEVRVRGGTRSVLETEKVYKGQFSDSRNIIMQPNCEKVQIIKQHRIAHEFTPTMVAVIICASFALLLLLIAVVVWRRCFQGAYYYLDDPPRIPPLLGGSGWEGDSTDELKRAIPAHIFPKHVSELHADGDIGFSKEYELIQSASVQEEFASEHSQHPENKQKNRYLNIVAYDHSRVRLQPMPGQKKCVDYVNANYIDGFRKPQAYIGTQGPLPSTFDSFWRMVWEHNVHIIVMITNLVERGRKKCDQYWPKEGSDIYGVIQVRLVREDVLSTYTIRTFSLKHLKYNQPVSGSQLKKKKQTISERTVYHYHYTNWPDHGTPSHPLPVLSFVKKSSAANPADGGPIIVHCSAGVGRTGTYIVLDAMLRQIRARGDLNIYGFLNHIRKQRNFLVQTEEQYIFIHDALLEAIESGETNVNIAYLSRYIHSLLSGSYADEKSEVSCLLERQYKLVTQFQPKDFHQSSALKACNLGKNRNIDNVCTDAYRVSITPKPGVEGSEYINATFAPGFRRLQEFIITQHPLDSTIAEFWQMLWDHTVQTVVVLTALDDQEYPTFWPSQQEGQDYDTFRVNNQLESENEGFICRDFSLQSLQDDYGFPVKMVHCPMWPHSAPPPISTVLDLVNFVQECVRESHLGPVAVVDRFGGTEAATFCCLTTCLKQIQHENHADIYMYAKLLHEQRPGVWKSPDDFLLLYRCVESVVSTSNGGTIPTPTSPSPLLPPPSIESFLASQIAAQTQTAVTATPPNGHINGVIVQNGNGRIPPDDSLRESAVF